MDRFTFFFHFFFSFSLNLHKVHFHVSFFFFLASQNSIWNTKQNFSRISFSKLSRWLRYSIKNLQCCEFLWVITNNVPRVHFYCAQYICLSFTSANLLCQNLLYQTMSRRPLRWKKRTSYSTFRLNLLQHLGEHSIISIELLQAAWLLPTTKNQPG